MRQSCRLILSALGGLPPRSPRLGRDHPPPVRKRPPRLTECSSSSCPISISGSRVLTRLLRRRCRKRPRSIRASEPFTCSATSRGRRSWEHSRSVKGRSGSSATCCTSRSAPTSHNLFFQGGNAALTTNMGTGLVLYRLVDQPNSVRRCRPRLSRMELLRRSVSEPRLPSWAERKPRLRVGRSSDRRSLSLRLWQRVRRYGLWRSRRLRRRRACRLAAHRHDRLRPQFFDQSPSGLSQPQF